MKTMKALAQTLVCVAIAILLSVGINLAPAAAATIKVQMGSDSGMLAFVPSEIEVSSGDTIEWVNNKLGPHNAVVEGEPGLSHKQLLFKEGESYTTEIPSDQESGTYTFYCEPHRGAGMQGKLTIK